jgi:hypothetical protein
MLTIKYTTKSEELRFPYVTAITWEDVSGSDRGEYYVMMGDEQK